MIHWYISPKAKKQLDQVRADLKLAQNDLIDRLLERVDLTILCDPPDLEKLGYSDCSYAMWDSEQKKVVCLSKNPSIHLGQKRIITPTHCEKCLSHQREKALRESLALESKEKITESVKNALVVLHQQGVLHSPDLQGKANEIAEKHAYGRILKVQRDTQKELRDKDARYYDLEKEKWQLEDQIKVLKEELEKRKDYDQLKYETARLEAEVERWRKYEFSGRPEDHP